MSPASPYYSPHRTSNQAWQGGKDYGLPSPAPRPTSPRHTSAQDGHSSPTADLAEFIARNQIVSTGLMKFDDKAENYWPWKASFCNVIDNLGLSVAEETDLLIKWLGKESSEQARRHPRVASELSGSAFKSAMAPLKLLKWRCLPDWKASRESPTKSQPSYAT